MQENPTHPLASPNASTGPRTESGKARSSRNATKSGLFTAQPFIDEGEAEEYAHTQASLMAQLEPEGVLEETYATEIMNATWRLRRCRLLEETQTPTAPDPQNTGIDRARAHAHNTLRRSLTELRRLQTERNIRHRLPDEHTSGLTDTRRVLDTLHLRDKQRLDVRKANELDSLEALIRKADIDLGMQTVQPFAPAAISFCKNTAPTPAASNPVPASTPRNSPCPCGSGAKYKRCCGTQAPPVLNHAA